MWQAEVADGRYVMVYKLSWVVCTYRYNLEREPRATFPTEQHRLSSQLSHLSLNIELQKYKSSSQDHRGHIEVSRAMCPIPIPLTFFHISFHSLMHIWKASPILLYLKLLHKWYTTKDKLTIIGLNVSKQNSFTIQGQREMSSRCGESWEEVVFHVNV